MFSNASTKPTKPGLREAVGLGWLLPNTPPRLMAVISGFKAKRVRVLPSALAFLSGNP
jgi:hypothetical protein